MKCAGKSLKIYIASLPQWSLANLLCTYFKQIAFSLGEQPERGGIMAPLCRGLRDFWTQHP
jgi:hypothetical protein